MKTHVLTIEFSKKEIRDFEFQVPDAATEAEVEEIACNKYEQIMKENPRPIFSWYHMAKEASAKWMDSSIGRIPIEDYLEIVAWTYGCSSYKELQSQGIKVAM